MSTSRAPTITVLYFAAASTETGLTSEEVELPPGSPSSQPRTDAAGTSDPATGSEAAPRACMSQIFACAAAFPLEDLAALLAARHPRTALGAVLAQSSWAVDAEMVDDAAGVVLRGGEEVAVICPVSGG